MSEVSRNKFTAADAIRDHVLNGRELTEKQEELYIRYRSAFTLLCNYHSIQQAVPLLVKQFNISETTAYRDISSSIRLFGNILRSDKEGHRYIVYEYAIKTYQLAAKNGDYKAMAQSVNNMIKLLGLDKENLDLPDFTKLKQGVYPVILDDPIRELLMTMLISPGKTDLTDLINQLGTQDAEHEDITD